MVGRVSKARKAYIALLKGLMYLSVGITVAVVLTLIVYVSNLNLSGRCTRPNDSNGLCPKTFSFNCLQRISPVLFLSAVTEKERKRMPFKREISS